MFSFVIPVYNVNPLFLKQCVDSILTEQEINLEVILIDDHSSNGCENVCDEYARQDERVKVFHQALNQGVSHSRNVGINNCCGEWIVFVDSDDWIENDFCKHLQNHEKGETDIVIFSAYRESIGKSQPFGTTEQTEIFEEGNNPGNHSLNEIIDCSLKQILNNTPPMYDTAKYCWGKAFRRDFLNKSALRFSDLNYCEDILFMISAYQKARRIIQIPDRLYHYRTSGSSVVNSYREQALAEQTKFLHLLAEVLYDNTEILYYASLLSMQICITRYLYHKEHKANIIKKHVETNKYFLSFPYSDTFKHVDISGMKRNEKWKALLIKHKLYYLYYLGTVARKKRIKNF